MSARYSNNPRSQSIDLLVLLAMTLPPRKRMVLATTHPCAIADVHPKKRVGKHTPIRSSVSDSVPISVN